MLSKKVAKALNEQVTKEIASSYLYLQMAAWFETQNLKGFATWLKVQAQEELAHGMIFYNFLVERGAQVELGEIAKPEAVFSSAQHVFERVLAHEEGVTASINNIMDVAIKDHDYATQRRLDWFISEQVEEEANATEIIARTKLLGDGQSLFLLDKDLGLRTFVMPPPLAAATAAP
jgi:ferritin